MNLKLKAALQTVAFGGVCVAIGLAVSSLSRFVTVEQFVMGVAVAGIAVCFYTMYSVLLARAQYEAQLKSMVDKK